MKKLFRILVYLFIGLILVIGIAAVALKMYLTPARVRLFVEKEVTSKIHREVKLGGISIGIFSGLEISDFALSEYPNFEKGTFVSAQQFQVSPQLLPLLSKKFLIDQLTLIQPKVNLVRFVDGTFNFSNLAESSPASEKKSSNSDSPLSLLVSKVVIESGQVSFIDKSTATASVEIDKLNVYVKNVSLIAPANLKTSFDVKTASIAASVDFEGIVQALTGSAKIKKLNLASGGSKVALAGEVKDVKSQTRSFDLKVDINKLEPAFLKILGVLPATVSLKDPITGDATLKGFL